MKLVCSFCGKNPDQVDQIVRGPAVNICSNCIDECNQLLMGRSLPDWELAGSTHKCSFCRKATSVYHRGTSEEFSVTVKKTDRAAKICKACLKLAEEAASSDCRDQTRSKYIRDALAKIIKS